MKRKRASDHAILKHYLNKYLDIKPDWNDIRNKEALDEIVGDIYLLSSTIAGIHGEYGLGDPSLLSTWQYKLAISCTITDLALHKISELSEKDENKSSRSVFNTTGFSESSDSGDSFH